jgi:hypothetical protein
VKRLAFEREFFQLAAFALACRLRVLGIDFECEGVPEAPLGLSLLGLADSMGEMNLLCKEVIG